MNTQGYILKGAQDMLKILAVALLITGSSTASATGLDNSSSSFPVQEAQIEPGIYVFVSFSMNDTSLRSYFKEASKYKARLIMNGLVKENNGSNNRFANTKAKMEKAKINVEINPNLFELLNIKEVPAIAVVTRAGIKKISGHIEIRKALEMMGEDREVRS